MPVSIDRSFLEQVDLTSLIEQKAPTRIGKPYGNGSKRTVKGPCAFCGGSDRFAVFVNDSPQRYKCGIHGNGCGAHGDAIDFLRQYEHLTFSEAWAALSGEAAPHIETRAARKSAQDWQSQQWQRQVAQFCTEAEARFWSDEYRGLEELTYLIGRGFTAEKIMSALLDAASLTDLNDTI